MSRTAVSLLPVNIASTLLISLVLQRTDSLLEQIPIIDTFLTSAKFDPRGDVSQPLVAFFRGTWYLCLLSGFLSAPARVAEWQRAALIRIAARTPCLLRGASNDFVETELEFNAILKSNSHALVSLRVPLIQLWR